MMLKLKIGTTLIPYSIRRSHRAKYVSISIGSDGVQVVAPFSLDNREIIALVEKKGNWIFNKFESYRQRVLQIPTEREFVNGEKLFFMGNYYPLKVLEHKGGHTNVELTNGQFIVDIKAEIPIEKRRDEIQRRLEQWFIRRAKESITERIEHFSNIIGVKPNAVRFKNQKTRWGSCSQKGNLNFNWKLVMAPTYIVDYVVVHELCHFKQMNHSPEFWMLVGDLISDYKERRKWLKQNGSQLKI